MSVPATPLRNPGPSWGYRFLLWAERWWPRWFFRPILMAGTWIGVACMPAQRAHSRDYLARVLGRPPRRLEIWRHFFAFTEFLILKLRTGRGVPIPLTLAPENAAAFDALIASGRPALSRKTRPSSVSGFTSACFAAASISGRHLATRSALSAAPPGESV